MLEFWLWITDLGNSKSLALVLFLGVYLGILLYVLTGKKRSKRLETFKYIPFLDDEDPSLKKEANDTVGTYEQSNRKS
jgi:cbb3-type cytochrome oxidase subunit 3